MKFEGLSSGFEDSMLQNNNQDMDNSMMNKSYKEVGSLKSSNLHQYANNQQQSLSDTDVYLQTERSYKQGSLLDQDFTNDIVDTEAYQSV